MIKDILQNNESLTPNSQTLEVLKAHFPQCFNKEGNFDVDKFKDLIKADVDITHEGYDLNFLGKNYAKLLASIDTTTVIQPDLEHNAKPENANSQNLYISGDNLDGLKHLLKSYTGAVKCIYIDPPYNTGSDGFVYNDNFNFTQQELIDKLSIGEEQAQKIFDLTTKGRASHSAWLTFMYPRLLLARDLLTPDGVIFISIDNNEYSNLKLLCDSIFGEENFIEMFSWVKTSTPPSLSTKSRKTNEYVLCYEKLRSDYQYKGELLNGGDQPLLNSGNNEGVLLFPKEKVFFSSEKMEGIIRSYTSDRVTLLDDIEVKNGYSNIDFRLKGEFKWTQDFLNNEISNGTTFIIKSELLSIRFIRQGEGWKRPTNYIKDKIISPLIDKPNNNVETNEGASSSLETLMGSQLFSFPKPVSLIQYLINFVVKESDIVVDFFSGSATTAESILNYNSLNIGSNLRFVLIQLPENLDNNLFTAETQSKSIIQNAINFLDLIGKQHTLDQIGMERICRAASKIKSETNADIDYGFKHYTLVEPSEDTIDKLEEFKDTELFTNNDTLSLFGKETVLETWLVKDGYGFGAKVDDVKLADYTAYLCGKHLYFIEAGINENDMVALLDKYQQEPSFSPENIVVFGYSFNFSQTEMLRKNLFVLRDTHKNLKANFDIRY